MAQTIVLLLLVVVSCTFAANLYPYGSGQGDTALNGCDNCCAGPFSNLSITYYGTVQNTWFLQTNGYFSAGAACDTTTPGTSFPNPSGSQPKIAPFFADVDTTIIGTSQDRLWYQLHTGSSVIDQLVSTLGGVSFTSTSWFQATWDNVGFATNQKSRLNQFQVVVAWNTATATTWACYVYDQNYRTNGGLDWYTSDTEGGIGGVGGISPAQVGFDSGDGTHYFAFPDSGTSAIQGIDGNAGSGPAATSTTNTGTTGQFCYQIDGYCGDGVWDEFEVCDGDYASADGCYHYCNSCANETVVCGVTYNETEYSVYESDGDITISFQSLLPGFTYSVVAQSGTAQANTDYDSSVAGDIVIATGDTSYLYDGVLTDNQLEPNETFELYIVQYYQGDEAGRYPVTVTILDSNFLNFTLVNTTVLEGKVIFFQLTASVTVKGGFSVQVNTTDITATYGEDYVPFTGTSFTQSQRVRTVFTQILLDDINEPDETFQLFISSISLPFPSNAYDLSTDFDGFGTIVNFFAANITIDSVLESAGTVTVNFEEPLLSGYTYALSSQADTADAGVDFQTLSATLAPGATSFSLTILDNDIVEADETFFVVLTEVSQGVTFRRVFPVTIIDDDVVHFTIESVTVDQPQQMNVHITADAYVQGGITLLLNTTDVSAFLGTDYSLPTTSVSFADVGSLSKVVTIPTLNVQGTAPYLKFFYLNIADYSAAFRSDNINTTDASALEVIVNRINARDTTPEGVQFNVTLPAPLPELPEGYSYTLHYFPGTADAGSDFVGVTSSVDVGDSIVTVDIEQDNVVENAETFVVEIDVTSPSGGAFVVYQDTVTISNDDVATLTISTPIQASEGSNLVFTVTASTYIQGGLTLDISTTDLSATRNLDYSAPSTVFFSDSDLTQTITVETNADSIPETTEQFLLFLTVDSASIGANVVVANSAVGIIIDPSVPVTYQTFCLTQAGRDVGSAVYNTSYRAGGYSVAQAFTAAWQTDNPLTAPPTCAHLATYETKAQLEAILASMTVAGTNSALIGASRVGTTSNYVWGAGALRGRPFVDGHEYANELSSHCLQQYCLDDLRFLQPVTANNQTGLTLFVDYTARTRVVGLSPATGANCFVVEYPLQVEIASAAGSLPLELNLVEGSYTTHANFALNNNEFLGRIVNAQQQQWVTDEFQCAAADSYQFWLGYESDQYNGNGDLVFASGPQEGEVAVTHDALHNTNVCVADYCNFASGVLGPFAEDSAVVMSAATGKWSVVSQASTAFAFDQVQHCNASNVLVPVCVPSTSASWLKMLSATQAASTVRTGRGFYAGTSHTFEVKDVTGAPQTYTLYFDCYCATNVYADLACLAKGYNCSPLPEESLQTAL